MQKIFFFLLFLSVALSQIGIPTGTCPENYHFCGDNCPLLPAGCLAVQGCQGNATECFEIVNQYCASAPADPGCELYGCNANRPYRCPGSIVCVATANDCPAVDPRTCALRGAPCGALSACPGQFYCSRGQNDTSICRSNYDDLCPNNEFECGTFYDKGDGLCSSRPDGVVQVPQECIPGGGNLPPYCYRFQVDQCQPGQHYCGYQGCRYEVTFCNQLNDCYRNAQTSDDYLQCQNLTDTHCINNPNDPGCCTGGVICPDGSCAQDYQLCPQTTTNPRCVSSRNTCPFFLQCPGKYFCGYDTFGQSICRDNFDDLCPTSECSIRTKGERPYTCGNGMCSGRPDDCVFLPMNGRCDTGSHLCIEGCPFESYRICESLGPICGGGGNINATCLAAINDYCTNVNPTDPGCCVNQQRCPDSGQCVDNLNQCPPPTISECVQGNATCDFPCPGKYYCGRGATCSDSLYQKCRDGPCAGGFYCGSKYGTPVCSGDPLQCLNPTPADNNPLTCLFPNERGCPLFDNSTFFNFLGTVCGDVGFGVTYSTLPAPCRNAIISYCSSPSGATDSGCCRQNQVRCEKSLLCVSSLTECGNNIGCAPVSVTCPTVDPNDPCPGQFNCGNGFCSATYDTPCPLGSTCPGKFLCDSGECTDVAGACNPPIGTPIPSCTNGGVVCSDTQTCVERDFGGATVSTCVCKQGFSPDLTRPNQCIQDNQPGGLFAACDAVRTCANPFTCVNGACGCPFGTAYDRISNTCKQTSTLPPNIPIDAQCSGSGDIHFTDFSGLFWDYQGTCDVVIARTPTLEVQVRPQDCGGSPGYEVSCVHSVGIVFNNKTIILAQGSITVDGSVVTAPHNVGGGATITSGGNAYSPITFTFGLGTVVFQPYYVSVSLDASLSGVTGGICGNWSSSGRNKLFKRDGSFVAYPGFFRPIEFTDDWIVDSALGDPIIFPTAGGSCRSSKKRSTLLNSCGNDTFAFAAAASLCGPILEQSANCSDYLDVSDFYNACIFDVCSTGENIFAQRLLNAVRQTCAFRQDVIQSVQTTTGVVTVTGSALTGSQDSGASSISVVFSFIFSLFFLVLCC